MKTIKSRLLIIVGFLFLTSCAYFANRGSRSPANDKDKFEELNSYLLQALEFRAESLNFAKKIKLDQISSPQMTRAEVEWVKDTGKGYLKLRSALNEIAMSEFNNFGFGNSIKITPNRGTKIDTMSVMSADGQSKTTNMYYIDPVDELGKKKIFDIQMSLAAGLVLMDNYLIAIKPYSDNKTFNYLLNYDTSQKGLLQMLADRYANPDVRDRLAKGIAFVDSVMQWRRENSIATTEEESKLYEVIQSSAWYLAVRNHTASNGLMDFFRNLGGRVGLVTKRGERIVSFGLSMGFGNLVGLVSAPRKGYLYQMSKAEKAQLISEMQPLDIVMEKTPFRLTDKLIPGHYGHVAIWVGTEAQLKELGVWNDISEQHQKLISQGHHMVEALRPGVQINTLDDFLNVDDLLVIRDARQTSNEDKKEAVLKALDQVGKEYDFNFDVDTHTRIVCSEIAHVTFKKIKWQTDRSLGRYTISPDSVAKYAVGDNKIFSPVIMYYNGKRYNNELEKSLALLLKESYTDFEKLQGITR